jgi:predicted  nucleic acid-binding Zn-ribbon protein
MTDNEIIKALECRVKDKCPECPYFHSYPCDKCKKMQTDALDLINRQENENDELRADINFLDRENEKLQAKIERLNKELETEKNQVIRLENQVGRLLSMNQAKLDTIHDLQEENNWYNETLNTTKAKAYKEFAEKIDKEFSGVGTCNYGCVHHKTRKVLKELVGDNK